MRPKSKNEKNQTIVIPKMTKNRKIPVPKKPFDQISLQILSI